MAPLTADTPQSIEQYPLRLFAPHMAEIFGVSLKRFYRLEATGNFMWAETKPRIGRKSWSRERVAAYFAGEVRGLTRSTLRRAG
jgi:hypothetical protein